MRSELVPRDALASRAAATEEAAASEAAAMQTAAGQSAAVALVYQEHGGAPRIGAKGRGLIAAEIVRRAREAGIFVHESREMVALLMQVDLDQHIPPQLYLAVAELLSWIYRLEARQLPRLEKPAS